MKKIVLVFGSIAGLITAAMFFISDPLTADGNFKGGEALGYAIMIIALSMIFVGIKVYRDKHLGGQIKFGTAFLVGLYITLISCVIYALGWDLYLSTTDAGVEGFMRSYAEGQVGKLEAAGASAEKIETAIEKSMAAMDYYRNPIMRFGMTILEMLPVGLLISLISAAILRKKEVLPANN